MVCNYLNQLTFPIMAVGAPNLDAVTPWLAPFPPQQMESLWPNRVSPDRGKLVT